MDLLGKDTAFIRITIGTDLPNMDFHSIFYHACIYFFKVLGGPAPY